MRPRDDKNINVIVNLSGFEARLDRIEHAIRHLPTGGTDPSVQQTLERIENKMSALTDQVARVAAAYTSLSELLDRALENDAADQAENDALRAERDALATDAGAAIAGLANIAPDPDEPPVEPPEI